MGGIISQFSYVSATSTTLTFDIGIQTFVEPNYLYRFDGSIIPPESMDPSIATLITQVNQNQTINITITDTGLNPNTSYTYAFYYYDAGITKLNQAAVQGVPYYLTMTTLQGQTPCFKEGSKILTDQGYKPIEQLKNGDLVKTLLNGYKPIVLIGQKQIYHPATNERIKEQLYELTKDKYPDLIEPLVLTGAHSTLVDNFTNQEQIDKVVETLGEIYVTDDKYRLPVCVDGRASVYLKEGAYTIYHLALENDSYYYNYGIYANGLLVESCSKRYLNELSGMTLKH